MIIEFLFDAVYNLFDLIFGGVDLPEFTYFNYIFDFIEMLFVNGATALYVFVPIGYVLILFNLTLLLEGALFLFNIVMFTLKKIPFLNIH